MKIKTLVAVLFLSAGATTVVAQDDANCNSNSSISHEAVKAGNFKDTSFHCFVRKLFWRTARLFVSIPSQTVIKF